jgi:hypothetical protein
MTQLASSTSTGVGLALGGIAAVLVISAVFYVIGRGEDRDRAAAQRAPEAGADVVEAGEAGEAEVADVGDVAGVAEAADVGDVAEVAEAADVGDVAEACGTSSRAAGSRLPTPSRRRRRR